MYKNQPDVHIADSLNNLGVVYSSKGAYDHAIDHYRQAVEIYRKVYKNQPHPHIARSLSNLGVVYDKKGAYDHALECLHQALEMHKKVYKNQPHPHIASSLNNLGVVYHNKGAYDQALACYHQALPIFTDRLGVDHPHTQKVKSNIAEVQHLGSQALLTAGLAYLAS